MPTYKPTERMEIMSLIRHMIDKIYEMAYNQGYMDRHDGKERNIETTKQWRNVEVLRDIDTMKKDIEELKKRS